MVSKNKIGNHAMNFLASVASYREEDETVGHDIALCMIQTYNDRTIARLSLFVTAWEVLCVRMQVIQLSTKLKYKY